MSCGDTNSDPFLSQSLVVEAGVEQQAHWPFPPLLTYRCAVDIDEGKVGVGLREALQENHDVSALGAELDDGLWVRVDDHVFAASRVGPSLLLVISGGKSFVPEIVVGPPPKVDVPPGTWGGAREEEWRRHDVVFVIVCPNHPTGRDGLDQIGTVGKNCGKEKIFTDFIS